MRPFTSRVPPIMRIRYGLSSVLLSFVLSGCALHVKTPTTRFITSETNGDFGNFTLGAGIGAGTDLELTPDYTDISPSDTTPHFIGYNSNRTVQQDYEPLLDASISVHDRIDLIVSAQLNEPNFLRAKVQLLGQPRVRRKARDFSLSLFGGLGYDGTKKSSSDSTTNTLWTAKLSHVLVDGGLVAGVRAAQWLLIYMSGYATYGHYTGFVEEDAPGGVTKDSFSGTLTHVGSTLGLSFDLNDAITMRLEAAYTRAWAWDADDNLHRLSGGAMLYFFF